MAEPGGWGDDQSYYEDEFVLHHHRHDATPVS